MFILSTMYGKSLSLILLILVLAFCAGCGDGKARAQSQNNDKASKKVRVLRVEKGALAQTVEVTGTLAPEQEVTLGFKVGGRAGDLYVDLEAEVKRGQQLARLEPTDFNLRVQQAEAALEQARARLGLDPSNLDAAGIKIEDTAPVLQAAAVLEQNRLTRDRMLSLHEEGLVSKAQRDDAEAAFRVAEARYQDSLEEVRNRQALLVQREAELQLAKQQLAGSILISPLDGAVQERLISRGQFLNAGEPAFRLVTRHPLRLRVATPGARIHRHSCGSVCPGSRRRGPQPHPGKVATRQPRHQLR